MKPSKLKQLTPFSLNIVVIVMFVAAIFNRLRKKETASVS